MRGKALALLLAAMFGISLPWAKDVDPNLDNLRGFAAVLPHFKVEKVPAMQALAQAWQLAMGGKPDGISFVYHGKSGTEGPPITLDLKNVPFREVIRYVAELSGCTWRMCGWRGEFMALELDELSEIDDSELLIFGDSFKLNETAAHSLGLRPSMSSTEVIAALKSQGVSFDYMKGAAAFWNAKSETLAVRVLRDELPFVRAIVRLANSGFVISKIKK